LKMDEEESNEICYGLAGVHTLGALARIQGLQGHEDMTTTQIHPHVAMWSRWGRQ
jgi:hypothetical protein